MPITDELLNSDLRNINVMYFDDHELYMWGVKKALQPLLPNMSIKEFTSGNDALVYVENCYKKNENLDLIISGIRQPIYDGFNFAKAIRDLEIKYNTYTPIMIISMCVCEEFALRINKALDDKLWNVALSKANNSVQICEWIKFLIEYPNAVIKFKDYSVLIKEPSQTENELLPFLCKNYELNEISEKLNLSSRTIEAFKDRIMKRYRVENLSALIDYVKEKNLID